MSVADILESLIPQPCSCIDISVGIMPHASVLSASFSVDLARLKEQIKFKTSASRFGADHSGQERDEVCAVTEWRMLVDTGIEKMPDIKLGD